MIFFRMMAAFFSSQVTFVLVFLCYLDTNNAINLDARFSIIKKGTEDSYFGYSVAQHQIVDEYNPKTVLKNLFVIGSPRQKGIGGAIYRCDASMTRETCQQMTDLIPKPQRAELIDDQWLGVSVASQGPGKKVVACAHRFIKDNAGLGVCYLYTQALDEMEDVFRPCEKLTYDNFMQGFGLCQCGMSAGFGEVCAHRYVHNNAALGRCYKFAQDMSGPDPFIPCKGMEHKAYMKNFGLCQAGTAVAIGQEDSLLMGAPGSVFWRGTVFLTNVTDELGANPNEKISPYRDPAKEEKKELASPTRTYSYQGSALTMGRFDSTRALYYVSGAPKGGTGGGSVIFYRQDPVPQVTTLRYNNATILEGPLAFSGFGSSLLAVDINNDGYDDLIVGAPYYFSEYTGGAFYVYLGGNKMISKERTYTLVKSRKMGDGECKSLRCEHARFGSALTKMGDVNMDSYQDFAVGAPYEGNGAVYIYHGQEADPGFSVLFIQRIVASDLPDPFSNIISFGHSLSGGMDLDQNGYPDLLVGAYESDTVALIRTRPIIRLQPSMTVSPTLINLDDNLVCTLSAKYKNRICVGITICVNYTTEPADSIQREPTIVYTLEAEKNRQIARVELANSKDANKKKVVDQTIQLKKGETKCTSEIALIKGKFDDKLNPVEFTFTFGLSTDNKDPNPYPTSAMQDINQFPILETDGASLEGHNDVAIKIEFKKECGDDQICKSDLQFETKIKGMTEDDNGEFELLISEKNEVFLKIELENKGEAAYLTRVYIQKPAEVTYLDTIKEDTALVTCQNDGDHMIWCDQIGNPLRTDDSVIFQIKLDVPVELAESSEFYNFTAWVNTSSTEETPDEDTKVMKFKVLNRAELELVAFVRPDNSILCSKESDTLDNEEDIGASVTHTYSVINGGPGTVPESYITIHWPYQVVSRGDSQEMKHLLYLMRKPKIQGSAECNFKEIEQYINPEKVEEVETVQDPSNLLYNQSFSYNVNNKDDNSSVSVANSRRKREAVEAKQTAAGVVVLDCEDKTATCFEFKCKLGRLEAQTHVRITMESRLWEGTLLSDYRRAGDVRISSYGQLTLPKDSLIQQVDTDNDYEKATTRAIPDYKEVSGQNVKWWIILVAVGVGIILLLIVLLILYKCGFFRRKRPEEMKMYKAEKKQQAMLTDYDEDGL